MKIRILLTLTALLTGLSAAVPQRTLFYDDPAYTFRLAVELFEKEKYNAAKELFVKVMEDIRDDESLMRADAEYYAGVSSIELRHPDGDNRLRSFVENYPGHARVPVAYFHLGKLYYERKSYRRAAEAFTNVTVSELTRVQMEEYYFYAGYSWFETGDYARAKDAFRILKDREGRFKVYATYYYAHVCYLDKDYDEALKHFDLIKEHRDFRPLIPYYYAQILYQQKRYSEMALLITPIIDQKSTRRIGTISRLIGDAFYKLNRYEEALGYMDIYLNESKGNISRIDAYQIGYVYYRTEEFRSAIDIFQKVTGPADTLSQNAYYHLADCYIKNGEPRFAMNAFLEAYKLGFDPEVTEDALYNYAKLSYGLAFNPYNQAIKAFEQFLGDYPESSKAANAQVLLVNLYISTKNYRSALASIEKVKDQNDNMRAAYQKVTWFRGIELFNDNNFTEAIEVFEKSLEYNFNRTTRALTYYWMGESWYRLQNWEKAKEYYNMFQVAPGAFDLPEFNISNYNIGYTWFKLREYDPALIAFRKFLLKPGKERPDIVQDATIRAADCYFMKNDYTNATAYYQQAAEIKGRNPDYAIYQQALAYGAMGKFQTKATLLEDLVKNHLNSDYRDDALFELGNTYQIMDNQSRALTAFNKLLTEYPKNSFERSALLKTGLIYYHEGKEDIAMKNFDKVFKEHRGTDESKEALLLIRDIYTVTDRVDLFYEYVKGTSYVVTDALKDSLAYKPSEEHYLKGDCGKALPGFINYIKQFPDGVFIVDAHFYKAECELSVKKYDEALAGYNFVTSQHKTKYTEGALARAAEIHIMNDNCIDALENYIRLEQNADNRLYILQSRTGQMRCFDKLRQHTKAYGMAARIIREKLHQEEIITEAHLIRAKAAMALDSIIAAQTYFETVLRRTKNEMAAEAKYNLALIQYNMHNYDVAEKEIFELINDIPSYDYWIAKAFILLSDVYVKTDNTFQAKHTLTSIIENYDGEDLVIEARMKLREIIELEKLQEFKKADEEIEIRMNAPDPREEGL